MPVEEKADIDIQGDISTLDQLDKAAQKAIKTLEKEQIELKKSLTVANKAEREQKRLDKRGGIFAERDESLPAGKGAPKDISKKTKTLDEILDEKLKKKTDKVFSDFKKNLFGGEELGQNTIKNIISIGKNPIEFGKNLFKTIPFIGGVIAFADFARLIIDEVAKLDAFFKAFVDRVDDRINQIREKTQQAHIQAGDIQLLLPTEDGGLEIREPYNTFNEFNNNRIQFENSNAIRDTSGV